MASIRDQTGPTTPNLGLFLCRRRHPIHCIGSNQASGYGQMAQEGRASPYFQGPNTRHEPQIHRKQEVGFNNLLYWLASFNFERRSCPPNRSRI